MSIWSMLFGDNRPSPAEDRSGFAVARAHPRYDPESMYIQLMADEIEALPIVPVSAQELDALMCSVSYTPVYTYAGTVAISLGEYGYDAIAGVRYVAKQTTGRTWTEEVMSKDW